MYRKVKGVKYDEVKKFLKESRRSMILLCLTKEKNIVAHCLNNKVFEKYI